MSEYEAYFATVGMVGGALCLDFTNTMSGRRETESRDHLASYADLLAWGRHAGALPDAVATHLGTVAAGQPTAAGAVLAQAVALREAIYRLAVAVEAGAGAPPDDLHTLNAALATALGHLCVVPAAGGFAWNWDPAPDALDRVLWPVARSAADLLTSEQVGRIRQCAGEDCGWLFLDLSRNHSRRWCDMNDCGNRAKARRHYHRRRAPATTAER